jgi:hypothetical protein
VTLPPPILDDLTWDAMVEAARRRIPAESGGLWTLHAPVDPGVTVLELFAYLLEQRLYWLDQVPDALVVAVLRLLGMPGPLPARVAATVLELTAQPVGASSVDASSVGARPVGARSVDPQTTLVPAGTVFSRDPLERITFTLEEDVAVLPLEADWLTLWAGGADRGADLAAGRGVPLLPSGGGPGEFRIVLHPRQGHRRPPPGTRLTLLFDLDAAAQCPPSWSPDAVAEVPPPATLTWSWYGPQAPQSDPAGVPAIDADVQDGTAGLRRSGIVRLRLPDDWCEGGSGEPPDRYGLRVSTGAATYSSPAVLRQIAPNVGAARHRQAHTVTDADLADQIRGWLRLPGQHLTLPEARGLLLEAVLRLRRGGAVAQWKAAPDFTFGGPADRIFVLDRDAGELRFGDGLTGAIPVPDPPGAEPAVTVEYVRGGGAAGNGGRTANWFRVGAPAADILLTASNPVPAEGGQDPETVAGARQRAAEELAQVHRAVTAADFEELAVTTPGVAVGRSHADVGAHPGYPCTTVPGAVTVRVVPWVPRADADFDAPGFNPAVMPDPGLLAEVSAHLQQARLVGTEVFVCPARYRRVDLRVDLASRPADPAGVRAALRTALRRYLDPLVGGGDGTGWPFGGPLRPSALLRVGQDALGDAADLTGVAIGLDGAPPGEDCADVTLRAGELAAVDLVDVRTGRAAGSGAPAGWTPGGGATP